MPTSELTELVRTRQRERRIPSISACVFRSGEVLWEDAVGVADVEDSHDATPDTQYRIGSITKTFTAVALLQLRDAGKVGLDEPLDRYVPESRHAPTIRRILAHSSGLQREIPGRVWESLRFPDRAELVELLGDAELVLPPMRAWHYSNLAYAVLGEVVTRLSGIPYERYVEQRLLEPLHLARTSWRAAEPAARGYLVEPYSDTVRRQQSVDKRDSSAAGGLWSTTRDLARWGSFLAEPDPAVLASDTAEEMRTLQVMADPDAWTLGWGLGLMLHRHAGRVFIGHDGGIEGFLTALVVDQATALGACALTNTEAGADVGELALQLAAKGLELHGQAAEPWRPVTAATPGELTGVLGRWWSEGTEWIFAWRGGRLEARSARREGRGGSVFEPAGADRFRTVSGEERGELLEVVRDGKGQVAKLYWATYPFTRSPELAGGGADTASV